MKENDVIAHNVKFYNIDTRAIHCMALERKKNKLALSRSDSSIEIWDLKHGPYLQKVIFNSTSNSVEDIKWFHDRLFSCGLEGYIVEYDCLNESVLYSTPVTGGPAWCIDINEKRRFLACGTEDGYINVFDVGNDKIEHLKFLDKQQGRILCICWDKTGHHLVTGSVDVIRVWNVDTGQAIHKMKTGRSQTNKETVVWCVAVTSDFTIISGDSRGYLCFWDGKIGTQIDSINSHGADILSLVVKEDESAIYCAGVDPVIAIFGKLQEYSGGKRKWARGGQRKIHEHDIRALALTSNNKLFSGGIDGYLALSSFPPKLLIKFPPLLWGPSIRVIPSKRYLLLRYLTHLELWKFGEPKGQLSQDDGSDTLLPFKEKEQNLLQLKAKKNDVILAAAMSEDGQFIAYSTNRTIFFFKFLHESTVSLTKLPDPSDCGPCRLIHFYNIKKRQFCAAVSKENEINILELDESGPDVIHTIRPKENEILTDTISHLLISHDGAYLIAADCKSNIAVWLTSNWGLHCTLPKYSAPVTAAAIKKGTNFVVIAYSDLKIIEYDLKAKLYTSFSNSLKDSFSDVLHAPVANITFDGRRSDSIVVHDDSSICVIYKTKGSGETDCKKMKLKKQVSESLPQLTEQKTTYNVIKKSKHIASLAWLSNEEMAVVSVCPLKLQDNLPPAFAKKRFGT